MLNLNNIKRTISTCIFFFLVSCGINKNRQEQKSEKTVDSVINKPPSKSEIDANNPIKIVQTVDAGNHSYSLVIGVSIESANSAYTTASTKKDSFANHVHIVSPEAVAYIWKYIEEHCVPADGMLPRREIFYNIGRASFRPLYKNGCRVESKQDGEVYFRDLITWIRQSPYKHEC